MKVIKTKKYEMSKIALKNEDPLRDQAMEIIKQRFIEIRPSLEGKQKTHVNPDENYNYQGRAEDADYVARQFFQSYFKDYDERGFISPDIIGKIRMGEYDPQIEEAWHNAANAQWYYHSKNGKDFY